MIKNTFDLLKFERQKLVKLIFKDLTEAVKQNGLYIKFVETLQQMLLVTSWNKKGEVLLSYSKLLGSFS